MPTRFHPQFKATCISRREASIQYDVEKLEIDYSKLDVNFILLHTAV
jgi:hypothetical protein